MHLVIISANLKSNGSPTVTSHTTTTVTTTTTLSITTVTLMNPEVYSRPHHLDLLVQQCKYSQHSAISLCNN
ncbi:hypothetical protein E2C01_092985 [Portunus trituberculatus]|uniref:Uncharacterized protein n=1 Tax=Portunus trituberculatus TaxID=210409 RepID=A0A5B7JHW8_PORTR|nr:hypothetical protein [Portunus trituberculatus]